jgi:hypothetical protein
MQLSHLDGFLADIAIGPEGGQGRPAHPRGSELLLPFFSPSASAAPVPDRNKQPGSDHEPLYAIGIGAEVEA